MRAATPQIVFDNASFSYESSHHAGGIHDITLTIYEGEVILLCGSSGCGKTTLTRLINGLAPHYFPGTLSGTVTVAGKDIARSELYDLAGTVGSVFQNPKSQFFTVRTENEMAFCAENLGLAETTIRERIKTTASDMKLTDLLDRSLFDLSGGQKQQIACASVSVTSPGIYVLDEPSSNLDMQATANLMQQIAYWKSCGKTIVIAEHRLHYLRDLVDRIVLMEEGSIAALYEGKELIDLETAQLAALGLRLFDLHSLKRPSPPNATQQNRVPTKKPEGASGEFPIGGTDEKRAVRESDPSLHLANVSFAYKKSPPYLIIDRAEFPAHAVIACIGHNGAGKSTFARCLCGLERKAKGSVDFQASGFAASEDTCVPLRKCKDTAYLVMQDVDHQLFAESVLDEVLLSVPDTDIPAETRTRNALDLLGKLGLAQYAEAHPLSLSGGQKQRVAIASAIASDRDMVIFDEPTSGLDLKHMHQVAALLEQLRKQGRSVLVITHDPELIVQCCTHVARFDHGSLEEVYELTDTGMSRMLRFFLQAFEDKHAEQPTSCKSA